MQSQLTEAKSDRCKHKLLEVSPIGLALCRTDGTFLDVNPAFASMIGCIVTETLNLNYWEILETECIGRTKKYLESQAKNSKTGQFEAAYKHKNGHLVPVRVSEWTIETEGEQLIWLSAEKILNVRDENSTVLEKQEDNGKSNLENLLVQQTAELAKANEQLQQKITELQEAQAKLQMQIQIIDQIHESVICTDMQGFIASWNQGSEKLYGYREIEVVGQHIALIYPPEEHEFLLEQIIKPLQAKGSHEVEVITRHKSGEDFYSHLSLSLLKDSNGEVCGMIGYLTDISDRKALETELARKQSQFDAFFADSPAGLCILDEQLRFVKVNKMLAQMNSLNPIDHIGKTMPEILPDIAPALEPLCQQILNTKTPILNIETSAENPRKPGVTRHIVASYFPLLDEEDRAIGIGSVVIEISDRKLAEEALRESEEQYRRIVETAAEGIWSIDASNNTIFVNQKMSDMLGYQIEEIIGKSLFTFMDTEGISIARSNLKRQRMGIGDQYDFKFRRRDGSELWAIVSASTLFDKQGSYAGCFLMIADITDRKQTEAALQQSEAKFRSLYELTSLPVFMLDENGIRDANTATIELFGCTDTQQLYGKHPGELSPPMQPNREDSWNLANKMIAIAFERGNHRFDWVYRRLDGTEFPAEVILTAIDMGDETIIQAIIQNLTDRKLAEEILVRSEQALRQQAQREKLLNQIASQIRNSLELDTILATAVQEIHHLMQLDWCVFIWYRPNINPPMWEIVCEAKNPALASLIGSYAVDEQSSAMVQQVLRLEILRLDDVSTLEDLEVREIYQAFGVNSVLSLPLQTAAGDLGVICCYQAEEVRNWSDSEVELMQAVAAQIAIAIDHAELYTQTRTAAELAQAQTQKLEQTLHQLQRTQSQLIQSEKMSSLGQLVAGVAHEINNPVNFIYGNLTYADEYTQNLLKILQVYQQEYPEPTTAILDKLEAFEIDYLVEDLPKILASMKVGADRIRDIVLSLRTFSRLDEAEMKKVNIHEGIESTLMILQNRLKNKLDRSAITVIKEYGKLPEVECYPGQLNQVFMNLLSNAIDALEMQINNLDNTTENLLNLSQNLEIRIQTVVTDNNCVTIRIIDSGPGISENVKKRLFDPFFTTKPIGKGTGLGLAISQSIVVEKHGGRFWCNSELGKGAEFAIEIPLRQKRN
jgi:PAS domain S-box-containing protein